MTNITTSKTGRIFDVLVVDDNPADGEILKYAFAACPDIKARLTVLENPQETMPYLYGMDKYNQCEMPDLILLDYHMPTNGGAALNEIKRNHGLLTPVIVLTGAEDKVDEVYRSLANCCFLKPTTLSDVLGLAREIVSHWLGRAALPTKRRPRKNH